MFYLHPGTTLSLHLTSRYKMGQKGNEEFMMAKHIILHQRPGARMEEADARCGSFPPPAAIPHHVIK